MKSIQSNILGERPPIGVIPFPVAPARSCEIELKDLYDVLNIAKPANLSERGLRLLSQKVKEGQRVVLSGAPFDMLRVVKSGYFKTITIDESGGEQVVEFPMRGNLLGAEAIETGRHSCETIALTDGEVILLPYAMLNVIDAGDGKLRACLIELVASELARAGKAIYMLGTLSADARIAYFLIELAQRFAALGYSDRGYFLRMQRRDIGSYLGVTAETVCRTLTMLAAQQFIELRRRYIRIKDLHALQTLRHLPPSPKRLKKIESQRLRRRLLCSPRPEIS